MSKRFILNGAWRRPCFRICTCKLTRTHAARMHASTHARTHTHTHTHTHTQARTHARTLTHTGMDACMDQSGRERTSEHARRDDAKNVETPNPQYERLEVQVSCLCERSSWRATHRRRAPPRPSAHCAETTTARECETREVSAREASDSVQTGGGVHGQAKCRCRGYDHAQAGRHGEAPTAGQHGFLMHPPRLQGHAKSSWVFRLKTRCFCGRFGAPFSVHMQRRWAGWG